MKQVTGNAKKSVTKSVTKLLGTIALGGTIASQLIACSPAVMSNTSAASSLEFDQQTYTFNRSLKRGTPEAKIESEKMALLAEKLIRSNTIHIANKVAFQALELNQWNTRAQFVQKMTAPVIELKGIYRRVLPIASVRPKKYREYKNFLNQIQHENVGMPDLTKFLLDGQPDLHRESEAQDVVEKYVERIDELRDWLKENRKQDFTLNYYIPQGAEVPACTAKEKASGVWEVSNCTRNVQKVTAKLNMADFEALRQAFAGIQVYSAMATAYSVDGIFKSGGSIPDEGATAKMKYESVSAIKGVGQLRNTKFYVLAPKVMSDFVVGYKVAKKLHKELCPNGTDENESRPGMLFHRGICAEQLEDGDRVVALLDALAKGKITTTAMQITNAKMDVTLDSKTFLRNPPKDLRDLGPVGFDSCGNVKSLGDGTAAGLFAKAELNPILAHESNEACQ